MKKKSQLSCFDKTWNNVEMPEVVGETEHFYGIYKPACWIVNVDEKGSYHSSINNPNNFKKIMLQIWLNKNLEYSLKNNGKKQYGIANRLDKETSGIIIVAKNIDAYNYIRKEMSSKYMNLTEKRTKKYYITLVHGIVKTKTGTITKKIGIKKKGKTMIAFIDEKHGMRSHTEYEVMRYYMDPDTKTVYTLLRVRIKTGMTHQIRVHMQSIGHPVASDPLYSKDITTFKQDLKKIPRLFLHSMQYSFPDLNGKIVVFKKLISKDLCMALLQLKKINKNKTPIKKSPKTLLCDAKK